MSSLSRIVLLIACIFVCSQASHFRYGTIQWRANNPAIPNGIRFETISAYRRNYPYCVANVFQGSCVASTNPNVGQYFVEGTFCFVNGGSCVAMWMLATAISTTDNWVIGNANFNFNYPASNGNYIADHTFCCRISTLQNNRDQQWRIESRVTIVMSNPNRSPICAGLPIVPVPQQQAAVAYQIPANDPDNDAITFTMASVAQLGGGAQSHPPGLSVTANGVVSLSTVSFVTGGLYTTQQIITDARGAYVPIDYIISVTLVKKTCDPACGLQPQQCFTPSDCGFCPDPDNTCVQGKPQVITTSTPPAPYSTPRTEPNGIVITVGVPTTFNLFFVAHDAQFTSPSKIVTIYNANIPPGASVSTQVPCNAASSCTCVGCNNPQIRVMTWTTTTADIGQNYPVCIGVRSSDNTELPNAQHCITVRVTGDPTTGTTGTTGTTSASTGTTRDPTTGTTTPPTSGTTGTTSARCPYDGLALKDVYLSDPEQMRTDHEVDSPFEDEFSEGRFELKLSQFFQSWLTRSHVTTLTGNPVRVGKYKARWDTLIEFIDLGAPGYFKGDDTIIQEYDLTTEELFWELPIVDIDSNNDWYAYLPDSSAPLVQIRGHVDVSQHVCVNYPLVPSPTSIFATIDFGSKWQRTDTKLALEMKYSYIEDLGSKKSVTLPAGTVEADLFGEFHPDGFPTTVSTSGGSVSVVTTTKDQRNGQASNKPEWDVWFTIDTTDHSPFTIELVTSRHD